MQPTRNWKLVLCCCAAVGAIGLHCGDDDQDGSDASTDTDADTDADTDGDTDSDTDSDTDTSPQSPLSVTFTVPDTFDATPDRLFTGFYYQSTFVGPPPAIGDTIEDPEIGVGQPYDYVTAVVDAVSQEEVSGEYYMYGVLYVVGGGSFIPEPGVDYAVEVTEPISFGQGPVDLGTLELTLVE